MRVTGLTESAVLMQKYAEADRQPPDKLRVAFEKENKDLIAVTQ